MAHPTQRQQPRVQQLCQRKQLAPQHDYYWKETLLSRPTSGVIISVKRRVSRRVPRTVSVAPSFGAALCLIAFAAAGSLLLQEVLQQLK